MKAIVTCIILSLLISSSVYAQNIWEWSDPFALTDSTSDNCNPFLFYTYYNSSDVVFMFWDRANDSLSTELWMNNMGDGLPPELVLSAPGVHYTHPKVISAMHYPYPDSLFYVLYQTDQNGNQDIYYIVYRTDGTFSDPQALTTGPDDDIQLSVDREMFYDAINTERNNVAWISGGQIYASTLISDNGQYFSDAVLIDSNTCSSPSVAGSEGFGYAQKGVLYERDDASGTHIYQSVFEGTGIWGPPEIFYDSTESKNPTRAAWYGFECWSTFIDTSWRIMIKEYGAYSTIFDISKPTPFNPAVLGAVLLVDKGGDLQWIAVTYPVNGIDEIYMRNMDWPPGFENFSNSGTMNRNPKFFNGESYSYGCWYDYLVWESQRNGHWQIWASKVLQCAGSVDENEPGSSFISTYPNPFTRETTIKFSLNTRSDVLVEVYDNRGVKVEIIANQNMDQGEHQLRWNSDGLAAGVYIIKMTVDDMIYTPKVVKTDRI